MRTKLFLTLSVSIGLVVLCTVLVFNQFERASEANPALGGGDGTVDATIAVAGDDDVIAVVPAEGQVQLSGSVTSIHLEGAVLSPRVVPTPLTITSGRGFGNGGELTGVLVDDDPSSIVWDGGTPFALRSDDGGLVLDPVTVDLADDGLHLVLGGGNHALRPGAYQLATPVAVGGAGIATPRDSVDFTAGDTGLFEGRGDATLLLGPDAPSHRFRGPGRVQLQGALQLTSADGLDEADAFDLGAGNFDLTFTPDDEGGWTVTGVADRG